MTAVFFVIDSNTGLRFHETDFRIPNGSVENWREIMADDRRYVQNFDRKYKTFLKNRLEN